MENFLGNSLATFFGITVIGTGFCAYMTGQAAARTWRPIFPVIVYCALLAGVSRFLSWGLFGGDLLSWTGYVVDAVVLIAIGVFAYRLTEARKMVTQYPWLYERAGLFGWRERHVKPE
jgi:hypothetical protein